jgi:methylated-DNA-[protein]-cysteine S-methyltransferase
MERLVVSIKPAYCIFSTEWGYFGFLATKDGLSRTCLPLDNGGEVEDLLLGGIQAIYDKTLFSGLQRDVKAYFSGEIVDFRVFRKLSLPLSSEFVRSVYVALQSVGLGKTITYADLALRSGAPRACRAVGRAMASNPLPLIVPCHRVIRSDGALGGFSALGGISLKRRLLAHEKVIDAH